MRESATVIVNCYKKKCSWIINGIPCAFRFFFLLFTWQQRFPPSHSSGSNLFWNIHQLPENDYYSVILVVSCLSCDYYVEFIEQGGKYLKRAFHAPMLSIFFPHNDDENFRKFETSININAKQFCCLLLELLERCFETFPEIQTKIKTKIMLLQTRW